jgi:hypothetical protein
MRYAIEGLGERIAHVALRCAVLLAKLDAAGQPVDCTGACAVVEVYPAAFDSRLNTTEEAAPPPGSLNEAPDAFAAMFHRMTESPSPMASWFPFGLNATEESPLKVAVSSLVPTSHR